MRHVRGDGKKAMRVQVAKEEGGEKDHSSGRGRRGDVRDEYHELAWPGNGQWQQQLKLQLQRWQQWQ